MQVDLGRAKRAAYQMGYYMLASMLKKGLYVGENPFVRGSMQWNGFNDAMRTEATGDNKFNKEFDDE
jgi:hypothetical protein